MEKKIDTQFSANSRYTRKRETASSTQSIQALKMSDNSQIIAMIATLEQNLSQLKAALNGEAIIPTKAKRTKKEKDPNAAPKEPNVWIKFTQRVSVALKEAGVEIGAAPLSKQFASKLREDNGAYDEWTNEAIVAAWKTWTPPEESKMAAAKRKASNASEMAASDEEGAKAEPTKAEPTKAEPTKAEPKPEPKAESKKERKPQSEETKAAAKAKRAANKAVKASSADEE